MAPVQGCWVPGPLPHPTCRQRRSSLTCPCPSLPQKEQLHTKGRPFRGMSEEEVFTEVANLFRGQEDLLSEFGQFLPEAKRSLVSGSLGLGGRCAWSWALSG